MLLEELLILLMKLRGTFSQERVFVRVLRQALGVLCTLGRRTVARVLAATGRDQKAWSSDYRLFSRSPWEQKALFIPVIDAVLAHCPGAGAITLAGDFTHLKKTGTHIPGVTCMRDPMSPPFHVNLIYGLRFFQVSTLCSFRDRVPCPLPARSVPVCFEASPVTKKPGKKASAEEWAAYKKASKERRASNAARQTLESLRGEFDKAGVAGRRLLATLDGGFCNKVFFGKGFDRIDLICRCRKDAALCFRAPKAEGRQRFYSAQTVPPRERAPGRLPGVEGRYFLSRRWAAPDSLQGNQGGALAQGRWAAAASAYCNRPDRLSASSQRKIAI